MISNNKNLFIKNDITKKNYYVSSFASAYLASASLFVASVTGATIGLAAIGFACSRYKVSDPTQYLVRTGLGIEDIVISKTGFQYPFQKYTFVSLIPKNYYFNLHAMSNQKVKFVLPSFFCIGVKDEIESLKKYCKFLLCEDGSHIADTIEGIIEGETRVLATQLSIEEIYNDRRIFKDKIIQNVQNELNQFGLTIYNCNIKELEDDKDSEYLFHMKKKILSEAERLAKVNIAEPK